MTQSNGQGRLGLRVGLVAVLSVVASLIGASPPEAQAQGRADVAIVDFAFQPGSILVQAGDTVTWMNTGNASHTVTADDGSVASGPLVSGAHFSHTFPAAGLFTYHCALHPQMIGAVTITQAPEQDKSIQVNQVPRTGSGTAVPGQPLLTAQLAMAVALVMGTGAVLGHRRPACGARWPVGPRKSPCCR